MIYVSVASMSSREGCLKDWLAWARREPVDRIGIYLDGYEHVPAWLEAARAEDNRIEVRASEPAGSDPRMAALGKLAWAARPGAHVVCDDDLVYAKGYVSTTLRKLDRLRAEHGPVLVSYHGSVVSGAYVGHYEVGSRVAMPYMKARRRAYRVHIPGTGCIAFRSPEVDLRPDRFERMVGIDSEAAVLMKADGVPVFVVSSSRDYVSRHPMERGRSIVLSSTRGDGSELDVSAAQTATIRAAMPWPSLPDFPVTNLTPEDMAQSNAVFVSTQARLSVARRKATIHKNVGGTVMTMPGPARSFEFVNGQYPPPGRSMTEAEAQELRESPFFGTHFKEMREPDAAQVQAAASEPEGSAATEYCDVTENTAAAEILVGEPYGVDVETLKSAAGNLTKKNIREAAAAVGVSFPNL